MNVRQYALKTVWIERVLLGALIGLSISMLTSADPASLLFLEFGNSDAIGAVGLVVGLVLLARLPSCGGSSAESSCGCDECGS